MGQWSDRLRQYDSAYQQAEAATNQIPDGRYKVVIENADIRQNTFTGDLELLLDMVVTEGDYADRHIFKRHNLENEQRFPFLKADLEMCGLTLGALSELEDRLHELLGVMLEVSLRTVQREQKTYQNCYLVRCLGRSAPSAPQTGAPAPRLAMQTTRLWTEDAARRDSGCRRTGGAIRGPTSSRTMRCGSSCSLRLTIRSLAGC